MKNYLEFEKYLPYPNKDIIVKTPNGLRRAKVDSFWGIIIATDCTHPMQNCNLTGYAYAWRYEEEDDMNNLLFTVNHVAMQKTGDEILKSAISNRSVLTRINKWIQNKLK